MVHAEDNQNQKCIHSILEYVMNKQLVNLYIVGIYYISLLLWFLCCGVDEINIVPVVTKGYLSGLNFLPFGEINSHVSPE